MPIDVTEVAHVQITVPLDTLGACEHFYSSLLGLSPIAKPPELQKNPGVWYRRGAIEVHVSIEAISDNAASKRHVCYVVHDLAVAREAMHAAGIALIEDTQPIQGWRRVYVRDPGGNRVELAERVPLLLGE